MAAPLAARGVKIGVLMGTAYLYTHEAVQTGAIQEEFQSQAMQAKDTVLLETAPGHETRCLNTALPTISIPKRQNFLLPEWIKAGMGNNLKN